MQNLLRGIKISEMSIISIVESGGLVIKIEIKWMNNELIFFFTSFHPYSPFAYLRWNDYKQTYCTTDSLLIVPPPMKCGAIWHMDKWGRLMANKEQHSFSPTRFGQKTNVFNQIYMFLRNIGCWKLASSWIFPLFPALWELYPARLIHGWDSVGAFSPVPCFLSSYWDKQKKGLWVLRREKRWNGYVW